MPLAESKKTITSKWLKPEAPTIEDWINIVQDIYTLEMISFLCKVEGNHL